MSRESFDLGNPIQPYRRDEMPSSQVCPPIRAVEIGIGEKVIVVSDFLINPFDHSASVTEFKPFIESLEQWDGPGVIVVAGNLLDLLSRNPADGTQNSTALQFDSPLFEAFRSLTHRAEVRIYLIPGLRDSQLAYDSHLVNSLRDTFPFELGLTLELRIANITGFDKLHISSGREFDPLARAADPYSPNESPWATHLLKDFWPRYKSRKNKDWLKGVERLRDPSASARFLLSRLTYRKAVKYLPWALLPLLITFLIRIPLVLSLPLVSHLKRHTLGIGGLLRLIGITTLSDAILILIVLLIIVRHSYSHFVTLESGYTANPDLNLASRLGAAKLIEQGYRGVIIGHFLTPELSKLGNGFFSCVGSISLIYSENSSIFGLPSVFRPKLQATWVEIEAGANIHVRLIDQSRYLKPESLVEKILISRAELKNQSRGQVAFYPDGNDYLEQKSPFIKQRMHRRLASLAIFLVGAVNLASALTPPIRSRLHLIEKFIPISVSKTADALVAIGSIALIFLAGGVRRGQRSAWMLTLFISLGAATLNIVKGGDFEEALTLVALTLYLLTIRKSFTAPMDKPSLARGIRTLVTGVLTVVIFSTAIIYGFISIFSRHFNITLTNSLMAVTERLAGYSTTPLPSYINRFATPALELSGITLAAISLFLIFRPVVDRSKGLAVRFGSKTDRERARSIISNHSSGTLDYFALRDDKRYFFAHSSVVAYANYGVVALVSPDPVGPVTTRTQAWRDFLAFANAKGWVVAVLGADQEWLGIYQETSMHAIYVGDEAIVSLNDFHLEGKKNKGLRQAVGRIRKYGYTAHFYDPSKIDEDLAGQIKGIMGSSRRGDAERGFSMTLGRILDSSDEGLLLTVCKDASGRVVGFCQWVPATGINGYSLDLMRRDLGQHPNGLTDFMIVATIEYLRDQGYSHLSLNFATMRAVLSGEMDSLPQRVEKWLLMRMSGSMQIESLWRFNSKFNPTWHPRYVVYDNIEHAPAIAVAIARAEAFWELPIIGRFLVPGSTAD